MNINNENKKIPLTFQLPQQPLLNTHQSVYDNKNQSNIGLQTNNNMKGVIFNQHILINQEKYIDDDDFDVKLETNNLQFLDIWKQNQKELQYNYKQNINEEELTQLQQNKNIQQKTSGTPRLNNTVLNQILKEYDFPLSKKKKDQEGSFNNQFPKRNIYKKLAISDIFQKTKQLNQDKGQQQQKNKIKENNIDELLQQNQEDEEEEIGRGDGGGGGVQQMTASLCRREVNNKIFVDIISHKIIKKLNIQNQNNMTNVDMSKQKEIKKNYQEVINDEVKQFTNHIMPSFKTVLKNDVKPDEFIKLKLIVDNMIDHFHNPQLQFNTDIVNKIELNQNHFNYMESRLFELFNQIQTQIEDRNEENKKILEELTKINEMIKKCKIQIYNIQQKIKENEGQQIKKSLSISVMKGQMKNINHRKQSQFIENNQLIELQQKIKWIQNQKLQAEYKYKSTQESIVNNEKIYKTLKEKKKKIQWQIRELYLNILNNNSQMKQESILWIIKALQKIGETANLAQILPGKLDKLTVHFLIILANKQNELEEKQKQLNQNRLGNLNMTLSDVFNQTSQSSNEIKKNLYSNNQVKQLSKIIKPVFIYDQELQQNNLKLTMLPITSDVDFNLSRGLQDDKQNIHSLMTEQVKQQLSAKESIYKSIQQLTLEIHQIKQQEVDRLIKLSMESKKENSFQDLKDTLKLLFGVAEAEDYISKYQQNQHSQQQKNYNSLHKSTKSMSYLNNNNKKFKILEKQDIGYKESNLNNQKQINKQQANNAYFLQEVASYRSGNRQLIQPVSQNYFSNYFLPSSAKRSFDSLTNMLSNNNLQKHLATDTN